MSILPVVTSDDSLRMADPDKIPETQSDTQATYDPTAEDSTQQPKVMENSLIPESQDFQLVDCDESLKDIENGAKPDKETEGNTEAEKDGENVNTKIEKPTDRDETEAATKGEITNLTEDKNESVTIEKKEEKMERKEKKELSKEEEEDDDVDFVQSSQLETSSPLKKQISSLTGATTQKRKAESLESDEMAAKFPRTCSQEGSLSEVRKRLDEEMDDIFKENQKKDVDNEVEMISKIIIQETPETAETCESLQQVEQELEETLSQDLVDEDYSKAKEDGKLVKSDKLQEEKEDEERTEGEKEVVEVEKPEKSSTEAEEPISKVAEALEAKELSTDLKTNKILTKTVEEAPKIPEKSTTMETTSKDTPSNDLVEVTSTSKSEEKDEASVGGSRAIEACFVAPTSSSRSRMSIEVIYERATAPPEKKAPPELVEIDEDGEKIVLDSSVEKLDSSYKTCPSTDYKSIDNGGKDNTSKDPKPGHALTNGNTESKVIDSDLATATRSDLFTTDPSSDKKALNPPTPAKRLRETPGRMLVHPELVSISDSDESFIAEDRCKVKELSTSLNHDNSTVKTSPIEKELNILVKLKCLVYMDETTKEHVEKIVTGIHCETASPDISTLRHRTSDNSVNMADISGNEKDTSPGSVTSNANPYPLTNTRLSMASVTSSSSVSSAGSLNAKLTAIKFQLPRGPVKHAKKVNVSEQSRLDGEDPLEIIKKEWKNVDTVTCTIMNFASQELNNSEQHNGSTLRVDNSLERIRCSTPEVTENDTKIVVQTVTPKRGTKRSRSAVSGAGKPTKAKNLRSSDTNGLENDSALPEVEKKTPSAGRKRKSSESASTPSRQSSAKEELNEDEGELVGKQVFAKWSDNKYYPGTVTGKTKTKFRVNFYDGQNKLLIEDFIVPMPSTLSPGLSVYATSDQDDYGSCGIILEVKKLREQVIYIVETDDGEKIEVDIKNIFLTTDQVQVMKEEAKVEMKSPPSTPKHLGKVTLDNVIDGKRRSKRILTPVTTTPKGKRGRSSFAEKMVDFAKPSASGVSNTLSVKFQDNQGTTSDSNFSGNDESPESLGVQEEIIGTPGEQESKGRPSSIKGKGRGRKKSDTPEIINTLGPIPGTNSDLFKGMSFILSCSYLETIGRYQTGDTSDDTRDSNSDPGTENEEEWSRKPFVRDRLVAQLIAGGGKVYDTFESIPPEDYVNTIHITNVPNTTRKSLLCLSVGIKPYNHQWVIRSCQGVSSFLIPSS